MTRRRDRTDVEWETPANFDWNHVSLEVLQDIRHELRQLNRKLDCPRIQNMFRDIARIDRRLSKIQRLKLK